MSTLSEKFTKLLAKMPMAMVVAPFAVGIFLSDMFVVPVWALFLVCVVLLIGVILLSKWWQSIAVGVMICALGALIHSLSFRGEIPYNTPLEMEIKVDQSSAIRKGYTSAEAVVEACANSNLNGCNIVVWGDSLTHFKAGDRLQLTTSVHPFKKEREKYARLMHHRGFVGSISLGRNSQFEYIPAHQEALHDKAVARLQKAMDKGDARGVVLAMTTGERGEISPELRSCYSASGASHLLAVSGLHIGIAFMLINLLLLPLVMVRKGNLWRSVVAIGLIWLYVWLCGFTPSAVRAAIMFSMLQGALTSLREYTSVNILAGTAFIMLAFNSHLLFDVSFQLSFIAVAGIILWAVPLYKYCITRYKMVNAFTGVVLVGLASTVATMPLVSVLFSTISLVGILINPTVILLANIVVLSGLVALALPSMATIAEYAALTQNRIVEWAAILPYGHFDYTLPEWAMWVIYALFTVVTILLWIVPKEQKSMGIDI
jgi:competence protein ComEC